MWILTRIFAIGLTLAIWALAAILIHYALALADDRRVRQAPPEEDAAGMLHRRDEEDRDAEPERQPDGGDGHG